MLSCHDSTFASHAVAQTHYSSSPGNPNDIVEHRFVGCLSSSSFCNTDTFSALFLPGLSLPSTGYPVPSTEIFTGSLWKTLIIPATTYWTHISISWVTLMLNSLQLSFSPFYCHYWNISMHWHQNLLLSSANTLWADDSTGQTQLALYFP